uniref:universal stress protein n=1 Tax=Actinoplanes solisilvae TaxID=2486853 RepID=UPI00196B411D
AACSVLVARTTTPRDGPIIVGVNGSSSSEQALDFAFETAARQQEELVVVRAVASASTDGFGDKELSALTALVANREDKYDLKARVKVLPGEPEAVLIAESIRAGLVVVGARGRRPYQGLLGSAAQTLLHHSPAPIILVRGVVRAGSTLWSRTIGPARPYTSGVMLPMTPIDAPQA